MCRRLRYCFAAVLSSFFFFQRVIAQVPSADSPDFATLESERNSEIVSEILMPSYRAQKYENSRPDLTQLEGE